MKPLKEFIIEEGFLRKNLSLGKEALIKKWLDEHRIINYTINDDLTIDVNGYVDLRHYKEKQLPDYIQFGKVTWHFYILNCPNLTSLKGCPKEVSGDFDCFLCPKLESLKGTPQKVGRNFNCCDCSSLTSLKGCPQEVRGGFDCSECPELESLEGTPQKVGEFVCSGCPKLKSLDGCPKEVVDYFNCRECGIKFTVDDVKKVCKVKGKILT